MSFPPNQPCPCHSGAKYKRCCRPLHRGQVPATPVALMRSRYAAFALGLADYVMDTTHPAGTSFETDRAGWHASISRFQSEVRFLGLEIVSHKGGEAPGDDEGEVTFRTTMLQGERDISFTERSRFLREGGRWLYHSGVMS